ncbi:MAG: hypothetical protein IPJ71_06400 [Bdellovibrionales bacterium]|nr:hypothetical protein [Bdellovibrionales bacterium]
MSICCRGSWAEVRTWPSEVKASLAKWKNITSVAYDASGSEASGLVVKSWKVESVNGDLVLSEELPLNQRAIFKNPSDPKRGGVIEWTFSAVNLSESPTLEPFVWGVRSGADAFTLSRSGEDKIILNFSERQFVLVLMPTKIEEIETKYLVGSKIFPGLSFTPNNERMIGDLSIQALFGIDTRPFPGPRYFFNHPVRTGSRRVLVNPNFPNRFIDVLKRALGEWNQLFGHNYYFFGGKQDLNVTDCLTENILCIQWHGGEEFTWTGEHGTSTVTADPRTGRVMGGIIYLYNDSSQVARRLGTASELALVENPSTLIQTALGFSRIGKYSQILRPDPEGLVMWLLLHEMGHFLGWNHNFAGAWLSDPSLGTVMGYPPFNLTSKFVHLGEMDRENFQSLYLGSPNVPTKPFCGDLDIEPTYDGKFWRKKIPECLMWSVGNSTDWLIANANILGVWSLVVGWDVYKALAPKDSRLGSFVAALGFIVKDGQSNVGRDKARNYLCSESLRDKSVLPFLAENLGLQLECRGMEP